MSLLAESREFWRGDAVSVPEDCVPLLLWRNFNVERRTGIFKTSAKSIEISVSTKIVFLS